MCLNRAATFFTACIQFCAANINLHAAMHRQHPGNRAPPLQICYYLYPLVSMAIFQIFTWTRIDDQSDDDIAQQYFKRDSSYILSGRFWTQHVDTKYFEGTHRTLALALGVPGATLCCGPCRLLGRGCDILCFDWVPVWLVTRRAQALALAGTSEKN
jgi:hypothetical protein